MTATKEFDYVAMLADVANPDNQQHIAANLMTVHRILSSEQYQKTIQLHYKQVINEFIARLLSRKCLPEETDYARGFIAAMQVVYGLPASVAKMAAQGDKSEKNLPSPESGY